MKLKLTLFENDGTLVMEDTYQASDRPAGAEEALYVYVRRYLLQKDPGKIVTIAANREYLLSCLKEILRLAEKLQEVITSGDYERLTEIATYLRGGGLERARAAIQEADMITYDAMPFGQATVIEANPRVKDPGRI